jgi:hypothetical protein
MNSVDVTAGTVPAIELKGTTTTPMRIKKLRYAALIPALAATLIMLETNAASAAVAGAGAGAVSGVVTLGGSGIPSCTLPPANPTSPCPAGATSYTFSSTAIAGTLVAVDTAGKAAAWTGTVNVSANGGSGSESLLLANGSVNVGAFSAAGVVPGTSVSSPGLSGTFTRVGPVVVVDIAGTISVTTAGSTVTGLTHLHVAALFDAPITATPSTSPPGVTFTAGTVAQFAGVFVGSTVA